MRLLLIGDGYWGKNWYKILLTNKYDFAVSDSCYEDHTDQNSVNVYKKYTDAVEEYSPTHIILSTPANTHANIVFDLVSNFQFLKEQILVEKPCGSNHIEGEYLNDCYPGFIFLHSKQYKYIKQNFKKMCGDPLYYKSIRASMGPRIRPDVNIISDYLIQDLYMCIDLIGNNLDHTTKTFVKNFQEPIQLDTVSAQFTINDVLCDTFSSWWYPQKTRNVTIVGSKGSFVWSDESLKYVQNFYSKIEGKDSYGNIGYELVTNDEVNIELSDVSSMENELKSFLNHEFPCVKINDVWNLINNLN